MSDDGELDLNALNDEELVQQVHDDLYDGACDLAVPSIPPKLARWAVKNCFLMRNRFNLVDLLDMMGLWTEERISWALEDVMEAA